MQPFVAQLQGGGDKRAADASSLKLRIHTNTECGHMAASPGLLDHQGQIAHQFAVDTGHQREPAGRGIGEPVFP
ncbi:hypothetical protein D3C80_1881470 [compost metagenome]